MEEVEGMMVGMMVEMVVVDVVKVVEFPSLSLF